MLSVPKQPTALKRSFSGSEGQVTSPAWQAARTAVAEERGAEEAVDVTDADAERRADADAEAEAEEKPEAEEAALWKKRRSVLGFFAGPKLRNTYVDDAKAVEKPDEKPL